MAPALAKETASLSFEMANEIDAFHAEGLRRETKRLADDGGALKILLCKRAIRFENQTHGFAQVLTRLF